MLAEAIPSYAAAARTANGGDMSFAVMEAARCRDALTFNRHFAIAGFRIWRLQI